MCFDYIKKYWVNVGEFRFKGFAKISKNILEG